MGLQVDEMGEQLASAQAQGGAQALREAEARTRAAQATSVRKVCSTCHLVCPYSIALWQGVAKSGELSMSYVLGAALSCCGGCRTKC